jgi:RNA polymerase subunit RPABC4/transcription elongation factor Spt4
MNMKYRILPILADLIPAAIAACDDILFDDLGCCPRCGGDVTDYDIRKKQFAVIANDQKTTTINVRVKRFRCKNCHAVVYAHQPFYPDTRTGSPIVDLCVTFSTMMPYARASEYLNRIGIIVDRWSIRNYAKKKLSVPMTKIYDTHLPNSVIAICDLLSAVKPGSQLQANDVLYACSYPSSIPNKKRENEIRDEMKK